MKKLIMTVAVLGCAAAVTAQTVTSQNIVGYSKELSGAGLQILSAQFDTGDNTPDGLFGDTLPSGTQVFAYKDGTYVGNIATYGPVLFGGFGWDVSVDLGQWTSFWVDMPDGSADVTTIVAGEVPLGDAYTNSIAPGLQLVAYPYPVQRTLSQLNLPTPTTGDQIFKYKNGTYVGNIATYGPILFGGVGWDIDLTFEIGDGFWYDSKALGTTTWIESRPFTP